MGLAATGRPPKVVPAIAAILCILLGVAAIKVWRRQPRPSLVPVSNEHPASRDPTDETQDVLVLVGSSVCDFSHDPRLKGAYSQLVAAAQRRANQQSRTFLRIGVAMDGDVGQGLEWLRSVGAFDEVDVGSAWLNNAVVSFLWSDSTARPSIPQIVLMRREIHRTGPPSARIAITSPVIVKRGVGLDGITAWVDSLHAVAN